MNVLIWIVPPLFMFGLAVWFNKQKIQHRQSSFWITSTLDALIAYSFTNLLLVRLVQNAVWIHILYFVLFVGFGLVRFWYSNVRSSDFDVEIETIKNIIIVFGTTFVPFLVLVYLLGEQTWYLRYGGAILGGALLFGLSLPIKHLIVKLVDKLHLQTQLISDLTLTIVLYVIGGVTLIGLVVFTLTSMYNVPIYNITFDEPFLPDTLLETRTIDWDTATIIDIDNTRSNRLALLIREANNTELLVTYLFPEGEDPYATVTEFPHNQASILTDYPRTKRFGTNYIDFIIPSEGLYIFTNNDIGIAPGTEGLPVSFVEIDMCASCFLVDNLDGTYGVWNSVFQIVDTIDGSLYTDTLRVIDQQLFLESPTTYTLFDDSTVRYIKTDGFPVFDSETQTMYTIDSSEEGIALVTQQQNGGELEEHSFKVDPSHQFHPLFGTYLYDPVKLFTTTHTTRFGSGLYIHSYQQADGPVFSILAYDPDDYLAIPNLDNTRASIFLQSYNNSFLVVSQSSISFTITIDEGISTTVIRLFAILAGFFVFIPITNYNKSTTTIDFDRAMNTKQ